MMRCSPLRGMASARWRRSIARLLMVLPCSASPAVRDDLRYTRRRPPWLLASAREEMQSLVLCETARSALAALVLLLASAHSTPRPSSLVPVQVDVVLSVALLSLYRERPADRGPLPSPSCSGTPTPARTAHLGPPGVTLALAQDPGDSLPPTSDGLGRCCAPWRLCMSRARPPRLVPRPNQLPRLVPGPNQLPGWCQGSKALLSLSPPSPLPRCRAREFLVKFFFRWLVF